MTTWLKEKINLEAIIKLIVLLVTVAVLVAITDYRVDGLEKRQYRHIQEYKEYRRDTVPATYVRKDVMDQILIRLKRIERKIDENNQ